MTQYKPQIDVVHRELSLMLPRFYDDAPEADGILYADAVEVEHVRADARELLAQLSVATATWGLSDWERVLELPPRPNSSVDLRRARILAKLRGTAPATIVNMLAIINAHVPQRDASIVELPEPGVINVEIPLQSGVALSELHADINTYKPAHLHFVVTIVARLVDWVITTKSYEFDVPYPICNMFQTATLPGVLSKIGVNVRQNTYSFNATNRITNEFTTEGYEGRVYVDAESTFKFDMYEVTYNMRLGENDLGGGLRLGGYIDNEETRLSRIMVAGVKVSKIGVAPYSDLGGAAIVAQSHNSEVIYKRANEIILGEVNL